MKLQPDSEQTKTTSTTLLSQMMGASLLSCAFIVHRLGWVLALLAFAITIGFDMFVYKYYVGVAHYLQANSYRELTEKAVSKKLSIVLDISIMVSSFGFLTGYLIISSSAVSGFLSNQFGYEANKYVVKAIISLCIVFPLTLLKQLKQLSKLAAISGLAILVTTLTIVVIFFMHVNTGKLCQKQPNEFITYKLEAFPKISVFKAILYFLMYIPSLQGNFTAHRVIPTLIRELQGPPVLKKKVVSVSINIAMFLALALYLCAGLMGAAMFGDDIKDNILKAFAPCQWVWIDICSLIYAMVVINAYPLVLYPIKMSIINLCKKEPQTKDGYKIAVIVSIAYVVLTTILAMTVEQILPIFGLFSSLTGIIFYFVVPICFYVNYPKIKENNLHMDYQNRESTLDPVVVGVLSLMSVNINQKSIQRIRTLSQKMFSQYNQPVTQFDTRQKRTVSFLRQKTFSFDSNSNDTQIQRRDSGSLHGDFTRNRTELIVANSEQFEQKKKVKDLQGRKIVAVSLIVLFSVVCGVGVVMNGKDVFNTFF
ncbi:Amino_acid transporter family protein [Hexamita inflata]|uniref:Amino acid transporter family protein n=1 Tax=Hexamita inflata TaxID=28002 RepID=A0AA86Q4G0_9EUKA|nr:Amino acid transporter family protein [Hexamita inflata]